MIPAVAPAISLMNSLRFDIGVVTSPTETCAWRCLHRTQQSYVFIWPFLFYGAIWGQVTTATITGTVKDTSGAVLPGAQIVLLNEDTGISRTVQSDAAGRYSATALTLGRYRITATLTGFQTEVRTGIVL